MASDARSRTSTSAKNAIKNRRDMADTLLYPCGSHAPCRRSEVAVQSLHTRFCLDSQGKLYIFRLSKTTRNCLRLWAGRCPICGGCSSEGTVEIPQSWENSKGMPSGTSWEQFFHLGWQMAERGLFGLMLIPFWHWKRKLQQAYHEV